MIGAILLLSLSVSIFNDLYLFAWGFEKISDGFGAPISPARWFSGIAFIGIYVMTIYSIANTCFKMIDDVPQQILRWMGGGAGYNMGGPEGTQKDAEAGVAGAGKRISESQGGFADAKAKARDAAKSRRDNENATDNNIKGKDTAEGRQRLADQEGYKKNDKGNYVPITDKKELAAAHGRAEQHASGDKSVYATQRAQDAKMKDNT